jgi:TonB family protein
MTAEILAGLLRSGVAISVATILVLLLRKPLRHWLGARATYAIWSLIPMTAVAVLIPAPTKETILPVVASAWVGIPQAMTTMLTPASGTDASSILLVSWLFGLVFAASVFARRQARFNRFIQRREHQPYDEVIGHGPAVAGLLRQRIVLPTDFKQRYNDAEQALVLAHEQVHLQRGDVHAQTLATALRCVFWFNPLLHFAVARFRFDQELACDAVVLAQYPKSRRSYGDAMLKTQMAEFGLPIGCHWQSSHPLKERIAMLKKPLPGIVRRTSGSILVAAVILSGSYSAWAAQPAVAAHGGTHVVAASASATGASTDASPAAVLAPPHYPADAIARKIGGRVVLKLLIGADGNVKNVKVESSKPSGVFDKVAIEAASKWKFNPSTSHGKATEGWVRVPLDFALDSHKKPTSAG